MEFAGSGSQQGNISGFPMKAGDDQPPGFAPPSSLPEAAQPTPKILCMSRKWWYLSLLLSLCLILVLIIGCLATPKWVATQGDSFSIEGGLLKCSNCDAPFSDMSYSDASHADACDQFVPDYTGYCDVFGDLKGAGGAFLFFDLVAFVLIVMWGVKLFLLFRGSEVLSNPKWLFYVVSTVATSSHILALIVWGGVSSATFNGDCTGWNPDGSKPELCSTDGPKLAIAVMVFLLLTTIVFWIIQCKQIPLQSGELNFKPAEYPNRPPEGEARDPQFGPAIELQIPNNL